MTMKPEVNDTNETRDASKKKPLTIRKDMAEALRTRTGLRAGIQSDGQPQGQGSY